MGETSSVPKQEKFVNLNGKRTFEQAYDHPYDPIEMEDPGTGKVPAWSAKILLGIKHRALWKLPQALKISTKERFFTNFFLFVRFSKSGGPLT